jgi:pRiA4b ORF-3-like protein
MARVKRVFQFRLSLAEVRPTVWRRIQVPADYTLARLHGVIQAVMDWQDYHLHEFTVGGRLYGDPDLDEENRVLDERTVHLRDLGLASGAHFEYAYDFGDNWQHVLEFEDEVSPAAGAVYPVCVGGECSAPPEDVGGVSGYQQLLEALADPSHEEHEAMQEWLGRLLPNGHDHVGVQCTDPADVRSPCSDRGLTTSVVRSDWLRFIAATPITVPIVSVTTSSAADTTNE